MVETFLGVRGGTIGGPESPPSHPLDPHPTWEVCMIHRTKGSSCSHSITIAYTGRWKLSVLLFLLLAQQLWPCIKGLTFKLNSTLYHIAVSNMASKNWVTGSICAAASRICWFGWFVLRVRCSCWHLIFHTKCFSFHIIWHEWQCYKKYIIRPDNCS